MKTYVVFTKGDRLRDTENLMSYLVEAADIDEAKEKVAKEDGAIYDADHPEAGADYLRGTYGEEWFVQELNPEYVAKTTLRR